MGILAGIDIVEIDRIERAIDRGGDGFIRRIYTPVRLSTANRKARPEPATQFGSPPRRQYPRRWVQVFPRASHFRISKW